MANTIQINNSTPSTASVLNNALPDIANISALNVPPNAPLDFGSLAKIFISLNALSSPPSSPAEGDVYFDDGTNTESGARGFRWYHDGEWRDLGLQEVTMAAIDGGTF